MNRRRSHRGFTLLEILIALTIGTVIIMLLASVVTRLTASSTALQEHGDLTQDARFAMDRMLRAVRQSRGLVLPQSDKPGTNWQEHVREETIPASPPEGDSSLATAVLAVSLSARIDLNADGIPDADNDGDGLFDEDLPDDSTFDDSPGIHLIDDGGDGVVDNNGAKEDDDEYLNSLDEDPINGLDDDRDGLIDEDPSGDMNGDGEAGIAGVDDDGDGQVDEGNAADDDEDGSTDEDWLDAVVFYLNNDDLIERHPVPWDETASDGITGRDFVETVIAEDVSRFRVERVAGIGGAVVVDVTLDLTGPETGETVSLHAQIRVGSGT